jgi:hypothetical protein
MPDETLDDLDRILARHHEMALVARAEAEQLARSYADTRHDCATRLRGVALPLMRDWSKRLSVEGYPTSVEDRIGCHPPSLVFRLAPHGGPESSLALACEVGRMIRFRMTVGGRELGPYVETPLSELDAQDVLQGMSRFVTEALEATLAQPNCGPPSR